MDSWILEIKETQTPDSWVGEEGWEPRVLGPEGWRPVLLDPEGGRCWRQDCRARKVERMRARPLSSCCTRQFLPFTLSQDWWWDLEPLFISPHTALVY